MPQITRYRAIGVEVKDREGERVDALRLYQDLEDTELLVVDNYGCEDTRQFVENWSHARYILATDIGGTAAPRDLVFREAQAEAVLCCDSHVLFVPGVITRLKAYYRAHPDCRDLIQGPLLYDDLHNISTHLEPVWRDEFWGTWATDPRGEDPEGEAFEIPMQGLGVFSCRKDAWLDFNPRFRGFGGEEGYIHEKFRQAGQRCLCLPSLRWLHRFGRPNGVPYPLTVDDKLRNYLIGHAELGMDPVPVLRHFSGALPQETIVALALESLWEAQPDLSTEPWTMDAVQRQRPVKYPEAREKPLTDGSLTLFHPGTREFVTITPLAAFLWESSTGGETVESLVHDVRTLFPEQADVEHDVLDLLHAFVTKGFTRYSTCPKTQPRMYQATRATRTTGV